MKYFFSHLPEIKNQIARSSGVLLMLDFDGTLSPIAPTPKKAVLPPAVKAELKKISSILPAIIISGRSLRDIKNKIKIKGLHYAGNHGSEWQIGGKKTNYFPGAKPARGIVKKIANKLEPLAQNYPGVLLENKNLSISIHYRKIDPLLISKFKKDVEKITKPLIKIYHLRILKGKKVTELRPYLNWNKGKFALFVRRLFEKKLKRKLLPLYVGDDITDEDAFSVLKKDITVRVGQIKNSQGRYYIKSPGQIKRFMRWLRANSLFPIPAVKT